MNLQRLWAVMQKEFIHIRRDFSSLALLIALPIIQLFLYVYAVDTNVDHIPLVVADQSLDAESQAYVTALEVSTYFDVIDYVQSEEEVVAAIDSDVAKAGLVIPPGFAKNVELGYAQVLFLVDGSDLFTVQSAYGVAGPISQAHAADILSDKIERAGLPISMTAPIDVRTRILYNPNIESLLYIIPSTIAMLLQTQSISLTSAAIVREREKGTMEQLLVTPVRSGELILGKLIPNVAVALINLLTIVGIGVFIMGVPFRGSLGLFIALALIYIGSGLGLGLLISTVVENQRQAQQIIMLVLMLGTILGGFMFPRYTMPPVLYYIGFLFPLTYFIPISRGIIIKGVGAAFLMPEITGLCIYTVLILIVAIAVFRRGLE